MSATKNSYQHTKILFLSKVYVFSNFDQIHTIALCTRTQKSTSSLEFQNSIICHLYLNKKGLSSLRPFLSISHILLDLIKIFHIVFISSKNIIPAMTYNFLKIHIYIQIHCAKKLLMRLSQNLIFLLRPFLFVSDEFYFNGLNQKYDP